MTLAELNQLDPARAEGEFLRCCGSVGWARVMTGARPFPSLDAMIAAGGTSWAALGPDDWLEAFGAHPQIGERQPVSAWSGSEQAGMLAAVDEERDRLASLNAVYRSRFGYIFIVCATGKSPAAMLRLLEARLSNSPAIELSVAAGEQRKITALRLAKMIGDA